MIAGIQLSGQTLKVEWQEVKLTLTQIVQCMTIAGCFVIGINARCVYQSMVARLPAHLFSQEDGEALPPAVSSDGGVLRPGVWLPVLLQHARRVVENKYLHEMAKKNIETDHTRLSLFPTKEEKITQLRFCGRYLVLDSKKRALNVLLTRYIR